MGKNLMDRDQEYIPDKRQCEQSKKVAHVVCLPSMTKTLGSIPTTGKTKQNFRAKWKPSLSGLKGVCV
jgi:hypothetical protein